jgi:sterol desaturase/sphingolipid hydroxylase (fatty acid hydroxylase superfamily)
MRGIIEFLNRIMPSFKSLKIYLGLNGFLCLLSIMQYFILGIGLLHSFIAMLLIMLFRNYVLINIIGLGQKKPIKEETKNFNALKYHLHVLSCSLIEAGTMSFAIDSFNIQGSNILYDLVTFIPTSFIFELTLDFFHYWFHRLLHIKQFYFIHRTHHTEMNPRPIINFYQHPIETIIVSMLPTLLALCITPTQSLFQLILLLTYKMYIEVAGHAGIVSKPSCSFTQFVFLPKLLAIELYTEDHHLHHALNKYNYSKRFTLWDKLFGTYKLPTY